jgi:hypothetical protein
MRRPSTVSQQSKAPFAGVWLQAPCIAVFLAIVVISQLVGLGASADGIAPLRGDPDLVRRLAHVARSDPSPTIQPFRAVVFSIQGLMVSPDPGLGDQNLLQQDLQRFAERLAAARLTELQAGDIRILPPAVAETSSFQPCEVLYARIRVSFQRHDAEWASSDTVLGAVHIEYVQRTIASFTGGKIVCAGAVTPCLC